APARHRWGTWLMMRMMERKMRHLLDPLDENGFAVLEMYLPQGMCARLIGALAVEAPNSNDSRTAQGETAVRARRGVVFARRNLLADPAVRAFAESAEVRSLVEQLAPGAAVVRAILFD